MVALAGAVVLVVLVGFALYRRHATSAGGAESPASSAVASEAPDSTSEEAPSGSMISATAPKRLTPEASILAERYRCICGCNDTLSVCTCKNPSGSEDMKAFLQAQADEKKSPEAIDRAMVEKFGPAALLSSPAPPQTLPSHAGAPPAEGEKKKRSPSGNPG
jgi:hypothetical protein